MHTSTYTNIAFISYKREDEKWAKWLQKKLEHYKLPAEIQKQNPDLEFAKNPRHVFKDTTDLSGGVLAKAIKDGLDSSKFLIVICSPRAAKSEWVCKEVQDFIDSGREEYIIPFIIDGEPYANNPEDECFPAALKTLAGERELLGININENGRESAAVKVVARLFDLRFDILWNRFQKEEKRKVRIMISGLIGGILFLLSIVTIIAWLLHQQRMTNKELDERNEQIELQYKELQAKNVRIEQQNKTIDAKSDSIQVASDSINGINIKLQDSKDSILSVVSLLHIKDNQLLTTNDSLDKSNNKIKKAYDKIREEHENGIMCLAYTAMQDGDYYKAQRLLYRLCDPILNKMLSRELGVSLLQSISRHSFVVEPSNLGQFIPEACFLKREVLKCTHDDYSWHDLVRDQFTYIDSISVVDSTLFLTSLIDTIYFVEKDGWLSRLSLQNGIFEKLRQIKDSSFDNKVSHNFGDYFIVSDNYGDNLFYDANTFQCTDSLYRRDYEYKLIKSYVTDKVLGYSKKKHLALLGPSLLYEIKDTYQDIIYVYNIQSRQIEASLSMSPLPIMAEFCQDGTMFAYLLNDGTIGIYDLQKRKSRILDRIISDAVDWEDISLLLCSFRTKNFLIYNSVDKVCIWEVGSTLTKVSKVFDWKVGTNELIEKIGLDSHGNLYVLSNLRIYSFWNMELRYSPNFDSSLCGYEHIPHIFYGDILFMIPFDRYPYMNSVLLVYKTGKIQFISRIGSDEETINYDSVKIADAIKEIQERFGE